MPHARAVAWEDVNENVQVQVVKMLRKRTRATMEDLEDAVANAAAKIVLANTPAQDVKALLYTSALNLIAGQNRRTGGRPPHVSIELTPHIESEPPSNHSAIDGTQDVLTQLANLEERAFVAGKIDRNLARMMPRDRWALRRHYIEGASHEEMARELGVEQGAVKVILYRARNRLERMLSVGPDKIERTL